MRIASCLAALFAVALCLPAVTAAQDPRPKLVIAAPGERPVALKSVAVRTEISGSLALTAVELTFHNPNQRHARRRAAVSAARRPDVVGMAMDVDGKLRDAVPVDKARGQMVFEDVTRARIDPALLSVTQGNNYKLRVYPILPERDKIVVLRYAETLATRSGKQMYRLPLHYADRLPQLRHRRTRDRDGHRPAHRARRPGSAELPARRRCVLDERRAPRLQRPRHVRDRHPRGVRAAGVHAGVRREPATSTRKSR